MKILNQYQLNIRVLIVSSLAFSVGLGIAATNIAKTLTLLIGLITILWRSHSNTIKNKNHPRWTSLAVFISLALLALTLFWTQAPLADALAAWGKHSKLVLIPLIVLLIRRLQEAIIAISAYLAAQIFLLVSSWLLALHVPVPWATADLALSEYAVFSSYLGQSIMSCVLTAVCWHLLPMAPNRRWKIAGYIVVILGFTNTIFIMQGRTGHLVAIAIISQGLIWLMPKRFRAWGLFIPIILISIIFTFSTVVQQRFASAYDEATAFSKTFNNNSSSGQRLNYWGRSIEAIAESPLTGYGVGSWNGQYLRLDQGRGAPDTFNARNPHQEFLLWGVEAGIAGSLMLVSLLLSMYVDSKNMSLPVARATQSVLLALTISCLFNSSLYDGLIGNFFCVTLGVLMALGAYTPKYPSINN